MEASTGYVNVVTDEKGISTIAFFHPAQNSLPSALLDELASSGGGGATGRGGVPSGKLLRLGPNRSPVGRA